MQQKILTYMANRIDGCFGRPTLADIVNGVPGSNSRMVREMVRDGAISIRWYRPRGTIRFEITDKGREILKSEGQSAEVGRRHE